MAESEPPAVPVVDLGFGDGVSSDHSDTVGHEQRTAAAWGAAMSSAGFVVITGHGVPEDVVGAMFSAGKRFFTEKTLEEKKAFNYGPYGNPAGGFTAMGTEAVGRTLPSPQLGNQGEGDSEDQGKDTVAVAPQDLVESFAFCSSDREHWQTHYPAELCDAAWTYRTHMVKLLTRLHRLCALGLGLDNPDTFAPFYTNPSLSLRLASYPPCALDGLQPGQLRYGEHHDYQGLTILALQPGCAAGDATGLQVHLEDSWHDVPFVPGAFIVNIGELMSLWTGGRWRSTLHRVTITESDCHNHRFSIPFFTGPNDDAIIKPLIPGTEQFDPITAGDHLRKKLGLSNT
eukprot:m.28202 g.28202  ORF g.28202 m.28202 type:complete len:343 (+) comp8777_c0_seq1:259-1287(+)